ncbi:anti-sigma factor [Pararhodobacter zhoushanensis]|uniref:anti-sigma factor n=1 Tax=Pararhodobacter zhoushanensis TaxID=2479545 RepID=UPI000F8DE466|nr:anti-sigma factor [Pararhodobacter zhoushanensis]
MSDTFDAGAWPPEDHDDLTAAEYVLGVLPHRERQAAQERAELDGGFSRRVSQWEGRLAVLNAAYEDGPVNAAVYPRIESDLFGAPQAAAAPARRVPAWRLWLSGGVVAATVVLAVIFWPQTEPPLSAQLTGEAVAFNASFDGAVLQIARAGDAADADHDYELWAIGADGVPRSLGLLRGESAQIAASDLEPGVTLAVSLEPLGGAPDGSPTGPVLAAAALAVN